MAYQYRVVPFIGQVKGGSFTGQNAQEVSGQLQDVLAKYTTEGWELQEIAKIGIEVAPGCLGGLLGHKAEILNFDQIILRRAV